jgi:hypothetical protein
MSKIEGGCLCGHVRYTCDAEPAVVAVCHCTHCQKQSGGAFSVNIGIPAGSLTYTQAQPSTFEDRGDSGQPVYRHFCGQCGSPIVSEVAAMPALHYLKAGTLDDSSWVQPQVAVYGRSAQKWVHLPDQITQFDTNPPR